MRSLNPFLNNLEYISLLSMNLKQQKYQEIKSELIEMLTHGLDNHLYYHGVHHTLDVESEAIRIAGEENGINEHDLYLLKIACLYHDSGFINTYQQHELEGCKLAEKNLVKHGLTPEDLEKIKGMIMATRIPQQPTTRLEQIISDADLDYLGRDDFWEISDTLYHEFKFKNIVDNVDQWNQVQINFFNQHNYFTETSRNLRSEKKAFHLSEIEKQLNDLEKQ